MWIISLLLSFCMEVPKVEQEARRGSKCPHLRTCKRGTILFQAWMLQPCVAAKQMHSRSDHTTQTQRLTSSYVLSSGTTLGHTRTEANNSQARFSVTR